MSVRGGIARGGVKADCPARTGMGEEGIALIVTVLVTFLVASLVTAASVIGAHHSVANRSYERATLLGQAAEDGLEVGRTMINGIDKLYPDTGFATLEEGAPVLDAAGDPLPGLKRWTYAGPLGGAAGGRMEGVIVSMVRDPIGGVSVRRSDVLQESFAKFQYFTDKEPTRASFGGKDHVWGPVHSNDDLTIRREGTTFHSEVRTARTVSGAELATFDLGYSEYVTRIDLPMKSELRDLRRLARKSRTFFRGNSRGGSGEASMRIEFVAIDLNGDGDTTDETEGFMRVYQSRNVRWVSGDVPDGQWRTSGQCGDYHGSNFVAAKDHPAGGHGWRESLASPSRACYLGGDDRLRGEFTPRDGSGSWRRRPGPAPLPIAGRPDADYLFPLSAELNPAFSGVVFVNGKVVVSGTLRGRVTLVATDEIIIGDDLVYAMDPGAGSCDDALGLFSGARVVIADNALNTPQNWGSGYLSYDDTRDEFIHASILALDVFTVEDFASGPAAAEWCGGERAGRGCLFLSGGIVQREPGAIGNANWQGVTGYVKRHAYDQCTAQDPPPQFPTTGYFARGQFYQVDPAGFRIKDYLARLSAAPPSR